mmetsp:Transcript_5207/g.7842  ORF Transcript_5207/g.7842 Transcript_5207/m.7842 type:complete len:162 (-) Transcript_5207:61-546(-)
MGIGWRFESEDPVPVGTWKRERGRSRSTRELRLPRHERENMLRRWGFTNKEIAHATRNILKAKHNRKVTIQNLRVQKIEEAMESTARRIKNSFRRLGGGGKKNKEKNKENDKKKTSSSARNLISWMGSSDRSIETSRPSLKRAALSTSAIDFPTPRRRASC